MQSIASRTTNVLKATMAYRTPGRARKSSRDLPNNPGNAHEHRQAPAQGGEATGARGRTGNQVEALASTQSTWRGKRPSGAVECHARRRLSVESRHCHYHRSVGCVCACAVYQPFVWATHGKRKHAIHQCNGATARVPMPLWMLIVITPQHDAN